MNNLIMVENLTNMLQASKCHTGGEDPYKGGMSCWCPHLKQYLRAEYCAKIPQSSLTSETVRVDLFQPSQAGRAQSSCKPIVLISPPRCCWLGNLQGILCLLFSAHQWLLPHYFTWLPEADHLAVTIKLHSDHGSTQHLKLHAWQHCGTSMLEK